MKVLIAGFACAYAASRALAAQPEPRALAAVWAREDKYWASSDAGDFDSYIKLFDERFTGWPCTAGAPTTKASITPSTGGIALPGVKRQVSLDKKAATGAGDFVVVYYRAKTTGTDSSGKTEILIRDFTHTWAASPAGWRIIGGMCRFEDPTLDK